MALLRRIAVVVTFAVASAGSKPFIRLAAEYQRLDDSIIAFVKDPTNEGWEANLLDMSFYVHSLKSMIRELDGGITLGTFVQADQVLSRGKPKFMNMYVDDEKFIMDLKISDEQLQRFYYMQKFAEKEWENFSHDVKHKKTMANLLL